MFLGGWGKGWSFIVFHAYLCIMHLPIALVSLFAGCLSFKLCDNVYILLQS